MPINYNRILMERYLL